MNSNTRATLLERLRDGADALAWDEFFARYWPTVYAYARHRRCSPHTAEEIVQDVMLKVFEKRDVYQYDPTRGRFRDWLGAVVRNRVAEHRRKPGNRLRAAGGDSDHGLPEPEADDPAAEAIWEAAFENALLLALLDSVRREIEPRTYLAFELATIEGLPGGDVARLTGLSRNAVYKARQRVLSRLEQLGASYRSDGRLPERIQRAMAERPPAAIHRALATRIENTMHSR
jgi:RNA polymerase sigma factor (sigma-70 family)